MSSRTYIDKSAWPRGPWNLEPDEDSWIDAATGLPCRAARHPELGHWCGYVQVPPGHPWHGVEETSADGEVHGGVTFSGPRTSSAENSVNPWDEWPLSLVSEPGSDSPDGNWWVGFDCAHLQDTTPATLAVRPEVSRGGTYKTLEFVKNETAALAKSVKDNSPWRNQ